MKLLLLILLCCSYKVECQSRNATNYYVDCSAGTNGSGSLKNPWNNLISVNSFIFKPGDLILFRRGTIAVGELWPKGSGNENAQITLAAYGTGPRPIINARGADRTMTIFTNIMTPEQERDLELKDTVGAPLLL